MPSKSLTEIRDQLHELAARVEKYESRGGPASELAENLYGAMVQFGRLTIDAIDGNAFHRIFSELNGGWWDRSIGRIPGAAYIAGSTAALDEGVDPTDQPTPLIIETDDQFETCSIYTLCWLQNAFPTQIRFEGFDVNFSKIARDQDGQPVDKDGRTLNWVDNGQGGKCYDGEIAREEHFFTEAEWLARHRRRAEALADGCRLLAALINGNVLAIGRSRAVVEEAAEMAKVVGQSVIRLLIWARLARDAALKLSPKMRELGIACHDRCNLDVDGVAWRVLRKHLTMTTPYQEEELTTLAMYIYTAQWVKRRDLKAAHAEFLKTLESQENAGLFQIIVDELEEKCPEIAADVLIGIRAAADQSIDAERATSPGIVEPRLPALAATVEAMTTTAISDMLDCSTRRVSDYAKAVKVPRPGRGQHSFKYVGESVVAIVHYAATNSCITHVRNNAKAWLMERVREDEATTRSK